MVSPKEVYEEAKKKEDENLLFRNFLKANADERELDKQFRRLHNEIFSGYDCDKCRNCCKEYDIFIPEQDLERDAKKLENEEMLMPLIKEKALKNGQDYFIENAFYFFAHAEEDCCNWIMSNFNDFRNEYMKSMLCLVLGIRGKEDVIPFLKSQVVRFIMDYPDERFEQGPLYGMDILIERLGG